MSKDIGEKLYKINISYISVYQQPRIRRWVIKTFIKANISKHLL
jgi:hypothetical protein